MKNFTIHCLGTFFFMSSFISLSAQQRSEEYLLVRMADNYDPFNARSFIYIQPEKGLDSAKGIYDLKKYLYKKGETPPVGHFYYQRGNTTDSLFNYFVSQSEALNYIASRGWKLLLTYPETGSGTTNERAGNGELVPVTTISSRPVFCFVRSR